jgi:hypothetical protein
VIESADEDGANESGTDDGSDLYDFGPEVTGIEEG